VSEINVNNTTKKKKKTKKPKLSDIQGDHKGGDLGPRLWVISPKLASFWVIISLLKGWVGKNR